MKYKLLITAGPTREPIDPVRFVSNYSTGTLGYTLARAARARGHQVTLISGPTEMPCPTGVKRVDVETAEQLHQQVVKNLPQADALIMGAAVADFRPVRVAAHKIKRSGAGGSLRLWQLELVENPDIVADAARRRRPHQAVVGFALETEGLLPNARRKLVAKNLDAVVATRYYPKTKGKSRGPFGPEPVDGAILERTGRPKPFRRISKEVLSRRILDIVEGLLARRARQSN
ncbi:MAG: phosphopantothenoylcysteine decarboxylase [Candidatus Omnitrophica bacterium]|nr:phosphopantothenoylcysteine decarboxylase [Candidatus Omnitrophota bacterium]